MSRPSSPSSDSLGPPEPVRSMITLALLFHLFAIGLAIADYGSPSDLQVRVKDFLAPYTQTLGFELIHSYGAASRYFLIHDPEAEGEHVVQVTDAANDSSQVSFPSKELTLPIRKQRYLALANAIGYLASADADADLMSSIAQGCQSELENAESVLIALKRFQAPLAVQLRPEDKTVFDPVKSTSYVKVYSGSLIFDGTQYLLSKISEDREVSPVERDN